LKTLRINKKPKVAPVVSQTEKCQNLGILPITNPTGNPFNRNLKLPKDVEILRKLQVKVDLKKIGEAPRVFAQKLFEA
jgi:hypothetical protein